MGTARYIDEDLSAWSPVVIDHELLQWSDKMEMMFTSEEYSSLCRRAEEAEKRVQDSKLFLVYLMSLISVGMKFQDGSIYVQFDRNDLKIISDLFEKLKRG